MFKKNSVNGFGNIYLIIGALISAGLAIGFFAGFFDSEKPKISGVKIIKKNDMLTVSYKKPDSNTPESEDVISWYFNGVEQPLLKGALFIPVPTVTDSTIEIECSVRRISGTTVSKAVRSKKYNHYVKSGAPVATPTTYETGTANAENPIKNATGTDQTNSYEDVTFPGSPAPSTDAAEVLAAMKKANQPAETPKDPEIKTPVPAPEPEPVPPVAETLPVKPAAVPENKTPETAVAASETKTVEIAKASEQNPDGAQKTFKFGTGNGNYFKSNSTERLASDAASITFKATMTTATGEATFNTAGAVNPAGMINPTGTINTVGGVNAVGNLNPGEAINTVTTNTTSNTSQIINGVPIRWNTLHEAIANKDYDQARLMLGSGASVNTLDNDGQTPLLIAISVNSLQIIDLLLRYNASIKAPSRTGKTPLHMAASKKATLIALLLIETEKGIIPRDKNPEAIRKNKLVNLTDGRNQTPLHAAASYDANEIATLLINNGADVNAMDFTLATPLHYAALNNSMKTVQVLYDNGANVNARDQKGQSPADLATGETKALLTTLERIKKMMTAPQPAQNGTNENSVKKTGK